MNKKQKRKFNAEFKSKIALEALQEKETIAQLAQRYKIHPVQISQWKKQMMDRAAEVFEKGKSEDSRCEQHKIEDLLKKIGELTMERDFLSKGLQRFR